MDGPERESAPHPGFEIAKSLKLGGCVAVLLLTVVAMALLMTAGRDPLRGYVPPESGEYYAQHLPELKAELEENVFPLLEGVEGCEIAGDRLAVTLTGADYAVPRAAILSAFDAELFEFVTTQGAVK